MDGTAALLAFTLAVDDKCQNVSLVDYLVDVEQRKM